MGDLIKFLRGPKSKLITPLNLAEPCYITDEDRIYIGGLNGNMPIPNDADLTRLDNKYILSVEAPLNPSKNDRWDKILGESISFEPGGGGTTSSDILFTEI